MRFVVTGNIGCGKSTICQRLLAHLPGHRLVSIDAMVADLYQNPAFQLELQDHFGTTDRKSIAQRVFHAPTERRWLEGLSQRFLREPVNDIFARGNVLIEFPLFFEIPYWIPDADYVVAVTCEPAVQLARVQARDNLSLAEAQKRCDSQLSMDAKAALAHAVIDTTLEVSDADLAQIASQAQSRCRPHPLRDRCRDFFETQSLWPAIQQAYSAPGRHYHQLSHLQSMFAALAPIKRSRYWSAIELAVWGHDLVYSVDPRQYPQNEVESARALLQLVRDHCSPVWQVTHRGALVLAVEMILATRNHAPSAFLAAEPERRKACELFLDADLAILGAPAAEFEAYDQGIAREWGEDPESPSPAFAGGRLDALRRLADREQLFASEAFGRLTAPARANLSNAIQRYSRLCATLAGRRA